MSYAAGLGALLALLLLGGTVAALFWWVRRPTRLPRTHAGDRLPLFSHAHAAVWVRDEEEHDEGIDATAELLAARADRGDGARTPSWSTPLSATARRTRTPAATTAPPDAPAPAPATTAPLHSTVHVAVPGDATLQFLPGRLEIITGADAGREVRFVRAPGTAETHVTFGRTAGEPLRHVQLHDATVSREHAVMVHRDGQWTLGNQSVTNPVHHNGRQLAAHESVPLRDGDRVEMGAVTFRFRS